MTVVGMSRVLTKSIAELTFGAKHDRSLAKQAGRFLFLKSSKNLASYSQERPEPLESSNPRKTNTGSQDMRARLDDCADSA